MRRLPFWSLTLLLLAACGGGGGALPDLRIDGVTPGRGSMLGGTPVTLTGEGIVEPMGGGFDGSLSVSVCGAPLTDLVVTGVSRAILLPGGGTATTVVGTTLTGVTSAAVTGSSDVVVQRPDGQRVVVTGAFACYDPTPLIDAFAATPDQLSRTQSVTFTWQARDPEGRAIRCSLDPGDGHAAFDLGDCTGAGQTHRYDTAGDFTAALEVVNEDGVTARAVTTVTVSAGAPPLAHDDALATAQRQTLTANLLGDNGNGADDPGVPAATVRSFGGGSLGGAVTDHAAGASVSHAGGTLTVLADGSLTLAGPTQLGTFSFAYHLANATGASDATVTVTVTSPPASLAGSTITAGATSLTADGVSNTTITVQLKDAAGFDLQESAGAVTLSSTMGTLSAVTDHADGRYSATLTAPTTAGTATVSGRLNGDALTATAAVDFRSGPAASVAKHAGDGATLAVGSTHTLQAKVVDAYGNPVAGHTVGWAVTLGGGSVASPTSLSDAAGVAEVVWTLGGTVGAQGATATAAGLTGSPLGFTVTAVPGAAAALSITTEPSGTAQSGVVLATQPVLQLVDADGNAVAASGVSVTATVSTGGTLAGTTTVATDANGQAAFTDLSISGLVGPYALGFSATGLTSATSVTIALTAGAAAQLAIHTGDGQTATAGSAVPTAIAVRVLDVSDNPVAGVSVSFVIASGGGSLTGASATTGADGVATLGSWTLGATAGANTLTASVAGLTDVTFSATGVAGDAANLNIGAGDGGTAVVGTTRTLSASVTDASANPVAGQAVAWAVTSGGGTLDAASSSTGADGLAQVVWTLGTVAGSQSVSATATGLNGSPLAFTLTATAGAATQLHIATAPSASTPSGSPIPVQPVVALRDAYGNAVGQSGVDVTATIASGGGTLGGTAVVTTDAAGRAAFTDLVLSGTVGVRTLAFTAEGLTTATSGDVAVTVGAPAAVTATADAVAVLAGGTVVVSALVVDDAANPIAGATVAWTSTNGGSFAPAASSTTDATGKATVTFTTSTTVGVTHVITATVGAVVGSTAGIVTQGVPTAVDDAPTPTSVPGDAFHTAFDTAFTLAAPGLMANDDRGSPAATVLSFGAGDLGGTVTDHDAGTTVTPLPNHTSGSLTVGADGSVGFTPPTGFTGLFSFTYRIGNTIDGTAHTSQAQASIAVGVRPKATDDTYAPALIGNVPIDTSRTSGFSVSTNDVGDALVLASAAQTNGTVTLDADGTFTFVPAIGHEGAASFSYTVTNGFGTSAPATVALVVGEPVWFVDASSATNGDGRLGSPFNCLTGPVGGGCLDEAAHDGGDAIFLYSGNYTGRLTLKANQRLVGRGASQPLRTVMAVSWPADAPAEPTTGGTAPIIDGGVTLASGNTLRGFDLGDVTVGAALSGTSFGTLTLSEVGISTNGQALDLNGGTLAGSFPRLSSSGGSRNIALTNVQTTTPVALGGASDALSGATTEALLIDGEGGTFTFAGSISQSGGLAVNVKNKSGGAVTLSGSLNPTTAGAGIAVTGNGATTVTLSGVAKKISTGASAGVSLSGNTGSTIAFTGGGLSIATTTGTGFGASGGGTVSVTGTGNTIASSGGMALTVTDTTIAPAGLDFVSLASGGSDHGVLLRNTGSGGLTVTGGSVAGSGGTIANTVKRGLSAVSTGPISLAHMTFTQAANANGGICNDGDNSGCNAALHFDGITGVTLTDVGVTGSAQMGINLRDVVDFTLANSSVANAGNEAGENGLNFVNVTGTVLIDNVQVTDSRASNLRILNGADDLTLSVTDSTFDGVPASSVDGLQLILNGSGASGSVTITDSTFQDNGSAGVYVVAQNGSAGLTLDMSGSTARSNRGGGILVATQATTGPGPVVDVTLATNTVSIDTTSGNGIGIRTIGPATLTGTIQGNAVTHSNAGAAGFGISVDADGTAGEVSDLDLTIDANTIAYDGVNSGIYVATGAAEFTNFAGHIGAVVSNNAITSTSGAYAGIELLLGNAASLCADVRGNDTNGATVPAYLFEPFDGTAIGLVGFSVDALRTLNLQNNRRNGGALTAPDVDTTVGAVGACVL